jgi:trans-2,3-dihydro-3-hydroxyanthranilate isomerase
MRYGYLHLDVFADHAFSGNQLAVFPDAVGLHADQMQQIAAEMAFSETSFVFPAESSNTDVRVRIFTPGRELPMAGHPTIGTAFALAHEQRITPERDRVTIGLGVGPTEVALEWGESALRFAWMTQSEPTFGLMPEDVSQLAPALGIRQEDIRGSRLPVQEVSSGVPFLFVPMASRDTVNRASVDRAALRAFFDSCGLPERPVFVFSLEQGDDDATVFSRMFAPVFGIPEDPATGGAGGPLGAYLLRHGAVDAERAFRMVNLQGVAMGRPSRIVISVHFENGRITGVQVGGTSVVVGAGFLEV